MVEQVVAWFLGIGITLLIAGGVLSPFLYLELMQAKKRSEIEKSAARIHYDNWKEACEKVESLEEALDGIASWIPDRILRVAVAENEEDSK